MERRVQSCGLGFSIWVLRKIELYDGGDGFMVVNGVSREVIGSGVVMLTEIEVGRWIW